MSRRSRGNRTLAVTIAVIAAAAAVVLAIYLVQANIAMKESSKDIANLKKTASVYEYKIKELSDSLENQHEDLQKERDNRKKFKTGLEELIRLEQIAEELDISLQKEHDDLADLKIGLAELLRQAEGGPVEAVTKIEPLETGEVPEISPWVSAGPERGEYRIGVGDVLYVSVWQNPDLTLDVTVRPDGRISFPLIDEVDAENLTLSRLDRIMTEKLKEFVRHADVSVSLKEMSGGTISVMGAVKYPGVYSIAGGKTVFEAIAMAKGATQNALLEEVLVIRKDPDNPRPLKVNFAEILNEGNMEGDLALRDRDIVYVPSVERAAGGKVSVLVLGEVNNPGVHYLTGRRTVLEAIAVAGGLTADATLKDVLVVKADAKGQGPNKVNLAAIFRQGRIEEDFALSEQDLVYVPSSADTAGGRVSVLVLGEVRSPGVHRLEGRKSALEAIAVAGGYTNDAVMRSVVVIKGGLDNPKAHRIDLRSVLKKGKIKEDMLLDAQDIVFVPRSFIANLDSFLSHILNPVSKGVDLQRDIDYLERR